MSKRISSQLRIFIVLVIFIAQSCYKSPITEPISEFDPSRTPINTKITVVQPSQSLTLTEPVLSDKIATSTPAPPSSTPTRTLSPTPMATLIPMVAKDLVFTLLRNNGDCLLPCVWGYTPGISNSEEVNSFLFQLGKSTKPAINISADVFDESGLAILSFTEEMIDSRIIFSVYSNQNVRRLTMLLWSVFDDNGEVVEDLFGQPIFLHYMEYYTTSRILESYGTPSRVLIAAFEDEPDYPPAPWLPFSIVLIYDEQGFLAEYIAPVETVGEKYRGCPWKAHIGISTWSPEEERPLAEVVPGFGRGMNELNIEYFKPLEEATGMTLDEFYQIFKEAGNTQCIETPRSLWSQP